MMFSKNLKLRVDPAKDSQGISALKRAPKVKNC